MYKNVQKYILFTMIFIIVRILKKYIVFYEKL